MNIYVEKDGRVHLQGENDGVLNLYTEGEITMHEAQGLELLKPHGGIFDEVIAYSDKVKEYLDNLEK